MTRRAGLLPAVEALAVLALTLPLAIGFGAPTLWFVVPFAIVTLLGRPYEEYGLTLRNPGSARFHAAVCLVVFGTYALGHYAFARVVLGLEFHPTLAPDLPELVIDQMLVVGLSEELFFRGYLQTQLNKFFGRPYRILGARYGVALPAAALLFGLCHVVHGDFTRLRTAFFGLLVGWLRERTDTIAVPAAYHGFANILYDFMQRSMR